MSFSMPLFAHFTRKNSAYTKTPNPHQLIIIYHHQFINTIILEKIGYLETHCTFVGLNQLEHQAPQSFSSKFVHFGLRRSTLVQNTSRFRRSTQALNTSGLRRLTRPLNTSRLRRSTLALNTLRLRRFTQPLLLSYSISFVKCIIPEIKTERKLHDTSFQ